MFHMRINVPWLIFNKSTYLIPISLIIIFSFTFLGRKKSWKTCWKVFGLAFIICTLAHYIFYSVLAHIWLPGGYAAEWKVINTRVLSPAIRWSFPTLINFPLWKLILDISQKLISNKTIRNILLVLMICLYVLFFIRIWVFELPYTDWLLHYTVDRWMPDIVY